MRALSPELASILRWESEGGSLMASVWPLAKLHATDEATNIRLPRKIPKLRNDGGIAEIRIGMSEFECIGASPPHDHPHVYLNMGLFDSMLCPYCATAFRFASALAPDGIMPRDCLYRRS